MELRYVVLLGLVFQLVAALLGTRLIRNDPDKLVHKFVYFLWFTFLVEICGAYMGKVLRISTFPLYIVYIPISYLFYFYWFFALLESIPMKKIVMGMAIVFLGISIYGFYKESWNKYHETTFVVGAVMIMICCVMHFRQLLFSDETLNVYQKLSFWVSTGLLLFNIGMVPFILLSDKFKFVNSPYYIIVILTLNFVLYGCYSLGFIWSGEKYRSS